MRHEKEEFLALRGPFNRSIKKEKENADEIFKVKLPCDRKKKYYYWEKAKGYAIRRGSYTFYAVYNEFYKEWMLFEGSTGIKFETRFKYRADMEVFVDEILAPRTTPQDFSKLGYVEWRYIVVCHKVLEKKFAYKVFTCLNAERKKEESNA